MRRFVVTPFNDYEVGDYFALSTQTDESGVLKRVEPPKLNTIVRKCTFDDYLQDEKKKLYYGKHPELLEYLKKVESFYFYEVEELERLEEAQVYLDLKKIENGEPGDSKTQKLYDGVFRPFPSRREFLRVL